MRPVQVDIQHEHHPRVLELTTTWECSRTTLTASSALSQASYRRLLENSASNSKVRGCDVESHCHSSMDFHPAPDCAATCTKRDESLVVVKTGASVISKHWRQLAHGPCTSAHELYLICTPLFNVDYSVFCIFKGVRDRWSSEVVRSHAIRTTTALCRLSPTADSALKLKCGTAQEVEVDVVHPRFARR